MKKIIILLSLVFMASFAHALEFKVQVNKKGAILIDATGDIVAGDANKLFKYIQKYKDKSVIVILESDGGLVSEALRMGHLIHETNSRTAVENHCASACALVFFAGHERYMTSNAKIGVHQMKTYSSRPDEASTQFWTSKVYEYADTVNLPKEILHIMFKTRHENMYYLSTIEAKKANISVIGK